MQDRFRGRLMFPVADLQARVLGFGARKLGEARGPKYVNSPTTLIYRKSELLFGAHQARAAAAKAGAVVVVEGYVDALAMHQAGVVNTVALMGTAVSEQQVAMLKRMAPAVVLMLDGDDAGAQAILRAGVLARRRGLEVLVAALPADSDPAALVQRDGSDAARGLVADASAFARFHVQHHVDRVDVSTAEGKDSLVNELRDVFADIPSSALREDLIAGVAKHLALDAGLVGSWLRTAQSAGDPRPTSVTAQAHASPATAGPAHRLLARCVADPRAAAALPSGSRTRDPVPRRPIAPSRRAHPHPRNRPHGRPTGRRSRARVAHHAPADSPERRRRCVNGFQGLDPQIDVFPGPDAALAARPWRARHSAGIVEKGNSGSRGRWLLSRLVGATAATSGGRSLDSGGDRRCRPTVGRQCLGASRARSVRGGARSGRDATGVGMRLGSGLPLITQVRQVGGQCLGHTDLGLLARRPQREHAFHVRAVRAPAAVFSAFVDDEIVLHRRCSNPVARRIAPSVPTGTVSESLPATVIDVAPSGLRQVSCEPACRTFVHSASDSARRTSRNFFATRRTYGAPRTSFDHIR